MIKIKQIFCKKRADKIRLGLKKYKKLKKKNET